MTKHNALVDTN